jgi:hypothetical protein
MRITRLLLGVGGLTAMTAAVAVAGQSFTTIITEGDTLPGHPSVVFDPVDASLIQIVVSNGGTAAINSTDYSDDSSLLYYNGSSLSTIAVTTPSSLETVNGHGLDYFDNVALTNSGTRLSFVGVSSDNPSYGIFQDNVGSAIQEIAYDGDNQGAGTLQLNESSAVGSGSYPMQVNGSGEVVYAAQNGSNQNLVVTGGIGFTPAVAFSPNAGYTAISETRLGVDTNGLAYDSLQGPSPSSNIDVYSVNGTATNVSGPYVYTGPVPSTVNAPQILGTANGAGVTATVFNLLQNYPADPQTDLVLHDTTNPGSPVNTVLWASNVGSYGTESTGEMSPNGQLAFFGQNQAQGITLQYYNVASHTGTPTEIAATVAGNPSFSTVLDSSDQPWQIEELGDGLGNPMINSKGTIVFMGDVSDDGGVTDDQALMEWQPGFIDPEIVLRVGQPVPNDPSFTIDGIAINSLGTESDGYKNALSDDNYLGALVYYDDDNEASVLLTNLASVPEPTTLALLPVAAGMLMRRRKRALA